MRMRVRGSRARRLLEVVHLRQRKRKERKRTMAGTYRQSLLDRLRATADWMDKQPEGSETLTEAMREVVGDQLPGVILLEFLRNWTATNPLRIMRMSPEELAEAMRAVERAEAFFRPQLDKLPCNLREAVEAWGDVGLPSYLPVETEKEALYRERLEAFLMKRRVD